MRYGNPNRRQYRYRTIAEKALGRKLKWPEQVHHVDGNATNDHGSNLVICPDGAYHALLHKRADALLQCGNPDWRACVRCKKFDSIENMQIHSRKRQISYCHSACSRKHMNSRYWKDDAKADRLKEGA